MSTSAISISGSRTSWHLNYPRVGHCWHYTLSTEGSHRHLYLTSHEGYNIALELVQAQSKFENLNWLLLTTWQIIQFITIGNQPVRMLPIFTPTRLASMQLDFSQCSMAIIYHILNFRKICKSS